MEFQDEFQTAVIDSTNGNSGVIAILEGKPLKTNQGKKNVV